VTHQGSGLMRGLGSDGPSRGQILIEVLIALAVMGMISVVFLGALYTSLHAARITDERSVGFTLATSQMEYVKTLPYSDIEWAYSVDDASAQPASELLKPTWWDDNMPAPLDAEYAGYTVEVSATSIDGLEEDIREITATAFHHGAEVFTLYNYELDR
jgi:type II secretory pathway pseudopilin PulG